MIIKECGLKMSKKLAMSQAMSSSCSANRSDRPAAPEQEGCALYLRFRIVSPVSHLFGHLL